MRASSGLGRGAERRFKPGLTAAEVMEGRQLPAATPVTAAVPPTASADLSVAVAAAPEPATYGRPLAYTITVTNHGPDPATGVTLNGSLLGGSTPFMLSASQGGASSTSNGVVAQLGSLAPGASATVTFAALAFPGTGGVPNVLGPILNTARVSADQADPDPSDDTALHATPVVLPPPTPLTVRGLRRFGFHAQPTLLTLSFSTAVFPRTAEDPSNYAVTAAGPDGRFGTGDDRVIPIRSATIDSASGDVTLALGRRLPLSRTYQLRVNAAPPNGLTDMFGHPLDGDDDGQPGGDYVARIDRHLLAGPAGRAPGASALTGRLLARHRSAGR